MNAVEGGSDTDLLCVLEEAMAYNNKAARNRDCYSTAVYLSYVYHQHSQRGCTRPCYYSVACDIAEYRVFTIVKNAGNLFMKNQATAKSLSLKLEAVVDWRLGSAIDY